MTSQAQVSTYLRRALGNLDVDTPLPCSFDGGAAAPNMSPNIKLMSNTGGRGLVYTDAARGGDDDPAQVRTPRPIPPEWSLFYFEVAVESIASRGGQLGGYVCVGLTGETFRRDRMPGGDRQSYGYSGEDGMCHTDGVGTVYGPKYEAGDVVGVLWDGLRKSIAFTHNGVFLGVAYRNVRLATVFPAVGLRSIGDSVNVNFGESPFRFDLDAHVKLVLADVTSEVMSTSLSGSVSTMGVSGSPLPRSQHQSPVQRPLLSNDDDSDDADNGDTAPIVPPRPSSEVIGCVVLDYLMRQGYTQSAERLRARLHGHDNTGAEQQDRSMEAVRRRREVQSHISLGNFEAAMDVIDREWPGLLRTRTDLVLRFHIQQFIELQCADPLQAIAFARDRLPFNTKNAVDPSVSVASPESSCKQVAIRGGVCTKCRAAMQLLCSGSSPGFGTTFPTTPPAAANSLELNAASSPVPSPSPARVDVDESGDAPNPQMVIDDDDDRTAPGKALPAVTTDDSTIMFHRDEILDLLFGLLAYPSTSEEGTESPLAPICDKPSMRALLWKHVNKALGPCGASTLQRAAQQTWVCLHAAPETHHLAHFMAENLPMPTPLHHHRRGNHEYHMCSMTGEVPCRTVVCDNAMCSRLLTLLQ
eukprot:PhM_4_TR2184/c0_g1_i1/m.98070